MSRMVSNDGGDGQSVQFHGLDAHGYQDDDTMGAGSVVASYLEKGRSDLPKPVNLGVYRSIP